MVFKDCKAQDIVSFLLRLNFKEGCTRLQRVAGHSFQGYLAMIGFTN